MATTAASLSATPLSGPVGTPISYQGSGFDPDTTVSVTGPLSTPACSATSDSQGDFQCSAPLPPVPQASYPVSATDGTHLASFSSLTVLPNLLDTPTQGVVGSNVTFRGYGWNRSDSVSVLWNGSSVCWAKAAANGTFACPTVSVPGSAPGRVSVTADDLPSGGGLFAVTGFVVLNASPLQVAPPVAQPASLDVGQTLDLSTQVSGGSAGYAYQWAGLPPGCLSEDAAQLACVPAASGTYAVQVNVSDESGGVAISPTTTVLVSTRPVVGSLEASRPSVDVGEYDNFSVAPVGGAAPFTFAWLGLPTGCSGTTAQVACVPTAAGSYTVSVVVADASGVVEESNAIYVGVDPALEVGPIQDTYPGADVRGSVEFWTTIAGGSGSDDFLWTGLPAGCSSASTISVECTPSASGNFTVGLVVTDSNGERASPPTLPFRVYSEFFAVGFPTESRLTMDLGQVMYFGEEASGGWRPYFYNWTNLPPGCANATTDNVTCRPTMTGTWWVEVDTSDQAGSSVETDAVELVVSPALARPTLTAEPGTLAAGSTLLLGATESGGTTQYAYFWSGLPPGCAPLDASTVACTPSTAGTYQVSLTVVDTNHASASSTTTVVVTAASSSSSTGALSWTTLAGVALVLVVLLAVAWLVSRRGPRRSANPPEEGSEPEAPVDPPRGVRERDAPPPKAQRAAMAPAKAPEPSEEDA